MKILFNIFKIVLILYIILCGILYTIQEKVIFLPQKIDKEYKFNFNQHFEELNIEVTDGVNVNGLLFKVNNSKGLIYYLHGNAGSLQSWGQVAKTYTDLNYDVFILDYRGYGKSEGSIQSQDQLYNDNQIVYDRLKQEYNEEDIIILGYSIGTGLASKLASTNAPKQLILQAPYYNLPDLMKQQFSFIPTFLLKYKFSTDEYLKDCQMPITIFHGNRDQVIDYNSALKLKEDFHQINLITLKSQGHNGMTYNKDYIQMLTHILK